MNAQEFEATVGCAPEQDDLERANCSVAGSDGHDRCGTCSYCGYPKFIPNFENSVLVCNHRSIFKLPKQSGDVLLDARDMAEEIELAKRD